MFGPFETYKWFESRGLLLKTESDGRMFPISDKSSSVVDILEKSAKSLGVQIICSAAVQKIRVDEDERRFIVECSSLPTSFSANKKLICDRIIMATGSSRIGYHIVKEFGHSLQGPLPSLFSFLIKVQPVLFQRRFY